MQPFLASSTSSGTSTGTVFGSGAAILLLKRLDDAIADGDQVLAVIRGFALNNDGSNKVGYTAPSVEGQSQAILRAQQMAGVTADSISYIEAHGTATPLGDPIEVAALAKAFGKSTHARQFCSIGTAKANVGHLDVASGATGLIKTVLQLENRTIPKLLHFEKPNPHLDLHNTPFKVAQATQPWEADTLPLRAGVSAFGMGGTNVHVIVEEAPALSPSDRGRAHQLFLWSAKTPTALDVMTNDLAHFFTTQSSVNLADAAYTLQVGRNRQKHRSAFVAYSKTDASEAIKEKSSTILREDNPLENPSIVFCFPGQGVQTTNMGRKLYESELVFREAMDECVRRGVPGQAARDFLLGHMNVLGAVIFEEVQGVFSDACNKAIEFGKPVLMRDDWKRVFEPEEIAASIQRIT